MPEILTQTELCRACARQVNEEQSSSRPTNIIKTLRCVGCLTLPGAVWRVLTDGPATFDPTEAVVWAAPWRLAPAQRVWRQLVAPAP